MDEKANYTKNKAFDKQYYLDLIVKHIKIHNSATRKEIDDLLWNKLPEWMNDRQRKNRITNLVTELRKMNTIENIGADKNSKWVSVL